MELGQFVEKDTGHSLFLNSFEILSLVVWEIILMYLVDII